MKKQNYQLRIVITLDKEVLAEVKMRRDTLEDLPNVPSLPGTIYNMIGDLCRLQATSAETDEPTADEGDTEPEPAPTPHLPPRVKIVPLAAPAPAPAAEPEPETLPTKAAADPTPPALPTEKHLTPASAPRGKGLPPKKNALPLHLQRLRRYFYRIRTVPGRRHRKMLKLRQHKRIQRQLRQLRRLLRQVRRPCIRPYQQRGH